MKTERKYGESTSKKTWSDSTKTEHKCSGSTTTLRWASHTLAAEEHTSEAVADETCMSWSCMGRHGSPSSSCGLCTKLPIQLRLCTSEALAEADIRHA